MQSLREKFTDPNSSSILNELSTLTNAYEENDLIKQMREGRLGQKEFARYLRAKLSVASGDEGGFGFTDFLSRVEEEVQSTDGWRAIAVALRQNLNDELGLHNGKYDPEKSHDVWRNRFHDAMKRSFEKNGGNLLDTPPPEAAENYRNGMVRLSYLGEPPNQVGAFAMLESLLEKEFKALQVYLKQHYPQLSHDELLYVTHHAGHEHSHVTEIATPLLQKCQQSPPLVEPVIEGMQEMFRLRSTILMNGILHPVKTR